MSHATHNGLLTTTAIVAAAYASAFLLAPAGTLLLFGLPADASAIWTLRLLGTTTLGFAALALFARQIDSLQARRAIDGAFLVMFSTGLAVAMWAQYLQVMNALGWIHVAIDGLFAVAFFWFLAAEDRLPSLTGRPA